MSNLRRRRSVVELKEKHRHDYKEIKRKKNSLLVVYCILKVEHKFDKFCVKGKIIIGYILDISAQMIKSKISNFTFARAKLLYQMMAGSGIGIL